MQHSSEFENDFNALDTTSLTSQEEQYVRLRTRGIEPVPAARGAGYSRPAIAVAELAERTDVQRAIAFYRETARQTALAAGAVEFTKDDATLLYLEAHAKSATATEEIKAVDSLVKLHGLATPEKVEVEITRADQLQDYDDEALLKMAKQDIHLSPEEYTVEEK